MAVEWVTESVRVSLFLNAPIDMKDDDWRAITGQAEAQSRQIVVGGRIYSGPFEGGQLNLAGTTNRIDIIFTPGAEPAESPLPATSPWQSARDKFFELTSAWIKTKNIPVVRVAFGAILLSGTTSVTQSYELLKKLLSSVSIDPDNMRDLIFRVSWPAKSTVVKDMFIHRITNWNAIQFFAASVTMGSTLTSVSSPMPGACAVRLEIDHSTNKDRREAFDPAMLMPIYSELVALASENAEKGERP
jgi:hypothetical protein